MTRPFSSTGADIAASRPSPPSTSSRSLWFW
jgi:hypothetical protein